MTPRQTAVFEAVRALWARQGYGPTYDELAVETGLSKPRVYQHVAALEAQGVVLREVATARSLRPSAAMAGVS